MAQNANLAFSYVWGEMDFVEMFQVARTIQAQQKQIQAAINNKR